MVGKEKVEKMLRQCADTAEMPGWNDALTVMTESVQKKAEALSDDELFSVAAGARPKIGQVSTKKARGSLCAPFRIYTPIFLC